MKNLELGLTLSFLMNLQPREMGLSDVQLSQQTRNLLERVEAGGKLDESRWSGAGGMTWTFMCEAKLE